MPTPILATKLYIPPLRSRIVARQRLTDRLNEGLCAGHTLTLISAPAGFGKTTVASACIASCGLPVAWLSLDAGDNDLSRFLAYVVAALQSIFPGIGGAVTAALESSEPPPREALLTGLINEIAARRKDFVLVLDDYHTIDAAPVEKAVAFLVEHQPPAMRLVIATREDPALPLARLRARGQLTELRAADLRFSPSEAAEFLNQVMALNLSDADVAALDERTEGWIAGLQLAALSLQGRTDTAGFIRSFTGSHHFVLDYLVEEVLGQQTSEVQAFLLHTSILDHLCGPLCDAVLAAGAGPQPALTLPGQETLEYLQRANLFIVPLDNERRWYRYHHLFAELLRLRLHALYSQHWEKIEPFHIRASQWYEDNGLEVEAFRHATAANEIERAERLIQGGRIPLHSLAAVTAVLTWLDSLPKPVLDARPWLWIRSAMSALTAGQTTGVEEKLQAAEAALAAAVQSAGHDDSTADLVGQIAAVRATLALARYQPEVMITQARRALEHLRPDNLPFRSRALRALGFAYQLLGDRTAARQAYNEAVSISQESGNIHLTVSAITGMGNVLEAENQLGEAAESYRYALRLLSDQGPPNADQEYIGLARISYEWNDLEAAEQYGRLSLQMARPYDPAIDRYIICEIFLARVRLARGDVAGAAAMLARTEQAARANNFVLRLPEIATVQVQTLLRQGHVSAAAHLARQYDLPLSGARVFIVHGDPAAALAVLEPYRREMEARGWADERLRSMVLQAVALHCKGAKAQASQVLGEALAVAEPGGFVRLFLDEGEPVRSMLLDFRSRAEIQAGDQSPSLLIYVDQLLAAFDGSTPAPPPAPGRLSATLLEPLSERELEILKLIALGLSNREIGERLFLALDTVKGHNRRIFDKLQVQNRTGAIARTRELGLL